MAKERFLCVHISSSFSFYVMSSSCSFATETKIETLHEKCWYFWSAQKTTQHVTAHISYKISTEFTRNPHIGAHNLGSTFQFQESEVVSLKGTFKTLGCPPAKKQKIPITIFLQQIVKIQRSIWTFGNILRSNFQTSSNNIRTEIKLAGASFAMSYDIKIMGHFIEVNGSQEDDLNIYI